MIYISFQRDKNLFFISKKIIKIIIILNHQYFGAMVLIVMRGGAVFPPLIPEVKNDLFKNSHILNEFGFCPF